MLSNACVPVNVEELAHKLCPSAAQSRLETPCSLSSVNARDAPSLYIRPIDAADADIGRVVDKPFRIDDQGRPFRDELPDADQQCQAKEHDAEQSEPPDPSDRPARHHFGLQIE